jgi:hypothetical protein
MPLGDKHLVYVTTEPQANHAYIISGITGLASSLANAWKLYRCSFRQNIADWVYFLKVFLSDPTGPFFWILGINVLLAILIVERVSSIPKYPVCFSLTGLKALHIHKQIMKDCSGAWFTFSYLAYLLVELIGVAVSSALLHYMESSFTDWQRSDVDPFDFNEHWSSNCWNESLCSISLASLNDLTT